MFNGLCHCRACTINAGAGPVHIMGVKNEYWTFIKGEDKIVKYMGHFGKMYSAKASCCGAPMYQGPEGGPFKGCYPRMFQISSGEGGKCCLLPKELMPEAHLNYENRTWNHSDTLPKF